MLNFSTVKMEKAGYCRMERKQRTPDSGNYLCIQKPTFLRYCYGKKD